MEKIAIFLPNWIGDVVMTTPAIRAIREKFPQAKLVAVSRPYVAATLDGNPWFDETWLYDKKGKNASRGWELIRRFRKDKFDVAVLFPNSFRVAAFSWLGGIKKIIGYSRYGRGFLLTHRFHAIKDQRGNFKPSPIIDDYNQLTKPLGIQDPGYRMELFSTPDAEKQVDELWERFGFNEESEVIGLNPGAAFGAAKHWSVDSFGKLARWLIENRNASVLVLCGPAERELANSIVAQAGCDRIYCLAEEKLSLGLSKACIKRLDCLITTDSGPRHFAAAFDRPVVSLFGPTFIEWTETYYPKGINLQKKVPCGPCQLRVCPTDHRCMRDLTVEEVYAATVELLNRCGPTTGVVRHAG
jgi:heptosyltransferase II